MGPVRWLGALLAVAAAAGCAPDGPTPPSVVIVLVDELRKDAADAHMAGVNAAARRGVVVEQMRSAAPWTYPSVISLMSGLYPQQHGADGHLEQNLLSRVDPGVPLLQRRLRSAGYTTAAFVTNPFLLDWNDFHDGFEHFDGSFVGSQSNRRGDESVWNPQTMFANHVNTAVRAHFDATPFGAPELLYIHYIDVHGPWHGAPFRPDYNEAVRYVDRKIMEVYDRALKRYAGNVLFIVTSDHGRALDDDRRVGFGRRWRKQKHSVHDYNLRIPFAVLPSAIVPQGVRVSGPASNVDVVPTLLDWLALEPRVERPGISLLGAIRGGSPLPADRVLYARNAAFGELNDAFVVNGRKHLRFFDIASGALTARRLFDLDNDPRETTSPDADALPAIAALTEAAGSRQGLHFEVIFDGIDADVEARLRALGYLGGDSADSITESRPSPE
jgi:arylsulfatase A-like enzyme